MSEIKDPLENFELKKPKEVLAGVDLDLVIEFFSVFSRFEHSLKVTGYLQTGPVALPDWHRLAREIAGILTRTDSQKLNEAVSYLNEYQPHKQMRNLEWELVPINFPDRDSRAVISVTRVRNNLFHGGKYKQTDAERDTLLIQASLSVIYGCLLANVDLKTNYEIVC